MHKLGCICLIVLTVSVIPYVYAQKDRVGMSDDIGYIIIGVDGYYSDGVEQYFRIGDSLIVRGSVSGSVDSVSIRVTAPDGLIWYESSIDPAPVRGSSYYISPDGPVSREWSSDNGFIVKAKRFTADDVEGEYRLMVSSAGSIIERIILFKRVQGSDYEAPVDGYQGDGYGSYTVYAILAATVVGAGVLVGVRKRKRSRDVVSM